jgi:hypothetical protein
MSSKWRRYEVLLPLQFNDGRDVPPEWLAEAVLEITDHFGAASYETQKVEGHLAARRRGLSGQSGEGRRRCAGYDPQSEVDEGVQGPLENPSGAAGIVDGELPNRD